VNRHRKKNKRTFALVETFIATLRPTRSGATCRTYTTQLQSFHRWLKQNRVDLTELRRQYITRWLIYLNKKGLSVGTRNNQIVTVRIYLRYLHEQGLIPTHADELIRRTDLPKLPVYLPRPLAPEIDRELQNRLLKSKKPLHKALLLTRRTGLRIGELMALDFNCIRTDFQGHSFLKVPLGKLNSERLVPLDNATIKLVEKLRNKGHKPRHWLMVTPTGKKTRYQQYLCALHDICQGLDIADKMTIHRLRHTYATSLLSAGMSLTSVMKLLGHRDYRMTLRYAEITQEAVGKQYFEALTEIEKRYHFQIRAAQTELFNPIKAVADVIRWLKNNAASDLSEKKYIGSLTKRLERVRKDIESFRPRENQ
jgi:site-specific recombinase XerD